MAKEKLVCGWCNTEIRSSECKMKRFKNEYGTIVERSCPKCKKVLAAYLEEAGDFLAHMRNF